MGQRRAQEHHALQPDPQAFRPPEEPLNVLQVALPTNFKAARFESDADTAILSQMQADIEAIRSIPEMAKSNFR